MGQVIASTASSFFFWYSERGDVLVCVVDTAMDIVEAAFFAAADGIWLDLLPCGALIYCSQACFQS